MISDWDKTLKEMGWDPHASATSTVRETSQGPDRKAVKAKSLPTPVMMIAGPLAGLAYVVAIPLVALFAIPFMLARRVFRKERSAQAFPTGI